MKHRASPKFWQLRDGLPSQVQEIADKNFALLKANARHPPLHLKKIGGLWSVRVGDNYRAVGLDDPEGIYWIWIGTHAEYDGLVRRLK